MLHTVAAPPQSELTAVIEGTPDFVDSLRDALADRYIIEREIGRGGMALVYLARDLKHDRAVAMKVLRPEYSATLMAQRFFDEIRHTSRLQHPGILPIYESDKAGDLFFYTMPYVSGNALRRRLLKERQLPIPEVVRLTREIAAALAYAHGEGIVHRDIKPENILLSNGHPIIADFGIARAVDEAGGERLTSSGLIVGTPEYMSPEQCSKGGKVDARSDVYSLACVVYEMLAGEPPFTGLNAQAVISRQLGESPRSIRVIRDTVPEHMEAAIRVALAKVPADRFQGAVEFAEAFAARMSWWQRLSHGLARRRSRVLITALVLVLAAAGVDLLGSRPVFHERDWLMVGDFRGPPDALDLARSVRELVTTELNQSKYIRTLPRQQVSGAMRLAGVPETTFLSAELVRELALRSSVRAVLFGSVERLGAQTYSITLHVTDAETGRSILSEARQAATEAELVPAVQAVSRAVRRGLGERPDAIEANRPLVRIATPSLQAHRKYALAIERQARGDVAGSIALLHGAISIDTGFASAWLAMGMNYITARNLDSARIALQEARRRPERLTDAQRYRLEADAAYAILHDLPAAVRWYELYLAEAPWSYGGRNNRGLYLSSMGRHLEALAEFRLALASNPLDPSLRQIELLNETAELVVLGRRDDARAEARQLTGPFAAYAGLLLASAEGNWAIAESLAIESLRNPTVPAYLRVFASTSLAAAAAAANRPMRAAALLDSLASATRGSTATWYRQARILLTLTHGVPLGPLPVSLAADTTAAGVAWQGIWLGAAGDVAGASRRTGVLQVVDSTARARLGHTPVFLRALISARREEWAHVIADLAAVAWGGEHDATMLERVGSHAMRWLVAEAYERLGRPDSARVFREQLIAPELIPPGHFALRGLVMASATRR